MNFRRLIVFSWLLFVPFHKALANNGISYDRSTNFLDIAAIQPALGFERINQHIQAQYSNSKCGEPLVKAKDNSSVTYQLKKKIF